MVMVNDVSWEKEQSVQAYRQTVGADYCTVRLRRVEEQELERQWRREVAVSRETRVEDSGGRGAMAEYEKKSGCE